MQKKNPGDLKKEIEQKYLKEQKKKGNVSHPPKTPTKPPCSSRAVSRMEDIDIEDDNDFDFDL